jgi:hypothetical protein
LRRARILTDGTAKEKFVEAPISEPVIAMRIEKWSGNVTVCSLSPSAFAFGFGAVASKRSEDGGERAVRAV